MLRRPARPARDAFTLIELLVVVLIIAILVALLLPAIQKVRQFSKRAQVSNDITQFTNAATAFKNDWGQVPPSSFCLPQKPSGNAGAYGPLQDASFLFLKQRYNRWPATTDASGNIIWTPEMTPFVGQPLQGNQCLVFFLGGPNQTGWAKDGPYPPSANANSKDQYMDISQGSLNTANSSPATSYGYLSTAPVYMDPFGTPYVYFGSNKIGGKYTTTNNPLQVASFTAAHPSWGGLTQTISPYMESANKYVNEGGCQIISAGENAKSGPPGGGFGAGGLWQAGNSYPPETAGADDQANFNNGFVLGVVPR